MINGTDIFHEMRNLNESFYGVITADARANRQSNIEFKSLSAAIKKAKELMKTSPSYVTYIEIVGDGNTCYKSWSKVDDKWKLNKLWEHIMYGAKLFEELNDIAKKEVLKEGYKHTKLGWFEGHLYSVTEYDDGMICIQGAFPYDDAEHYWARHIEGDNGFTIYYNGKSYKKFPSMNYEEVAAELASYNKLVKPKMIHESVEDDFTGAALTISNLANAIQEYNPDCNEKDAQEAAKIFYNWYSNEGEEFCPDVRDMLDMLDAADDIAERDFCAKALGHADDYSDDDYSDDDYSDVEESFKSADTFTTTRGKKAFGKWFVPDDDDDGDVDKDDFMAFMKAHYSTPGLDSSNWTDDMWETARSFYNEALKESLNESELIEKFDVKQAVKAIKDNAAKAKDFVNNNPKLNKLLDKAEAMLHNSSNIKNADKIAYMISMIRDWLNGSYKDIPVNAIVGLTAALLYWILPDLIPGPVDDMGVLAIALKAFGKDIDNYIVWKNNNADK